MDAYLIEITHYATGEYMIVVWYDDKEGNPSCMSTIVNNVDIDELRNVFPGAEIEVY